jgi:transcriptional regulator with XRE-family HTH domain
VEELGRRARLGYKHVADIERAVKAPSFDAIDRLASAIGVESFELFIPSADPSVASNLKLRSIVEELDRAGTPAMKRFVSSVLAAARDFESSPSMRKGRES